MQKFKPLEDLLKQDPTMEVFGHQDPATGEVLPMGVEHLHERMSALGLSSNVPEEIQSYFNTARNLFVFSYYHYGFVPVAGYLALSAVEMAVRTVYPWREEPNSADKPDQRSFRSLLDRAVKDRRLCEEGFTSLPASRARYRAVMKEFAAHEGLEYFANPTFYPRVFAESSAKLRNRFAHPGEGYLLLTPEMVFPLFQRSAEAIDQLFKPTNSGDSD